MKTLTMTLFLLFLTTNLYAGCNDFINKLKQSNIIVSVKTCTVSEK